ncbi:MAG: hypothetical protein WBV94_05565, partial [Blastocatellia bacterium]
PHKPCKGEINHLVYFALTGLVVYLDARHRAMPCAIEFRPFRADSYVEFTLNKVSSPQSDPLR